MSKSEKSLNTPFIGDNNSYPPPPKISCRSPHLSTSGDYSLNTK